jgi:N-acetylgalactosamine-6-sulfatase
MLKEAGYATGHFGKWHLSNSHVPDAPLPPDYGYNEYGAFNLPGNAPEQMRTWETFPRACEFIRRHKDEPFFVNVWIHETHTPHYPRKEYLRKFDHLDEQKQVYASIVAEGDAGVGRILDTLEELGLDEKTLIIFSSDNGPERTGKRKAQDDLSIGRGLGTYFSVGEKGELKGQKRSLYAGGIRTPFIARWPGVIPAGKVDRTSVITAVDLLPTFIDVAGIELPKGYDGDGESIVAALKGQRFQRNKPIFWQWRASRDHPEVWPHLGIRDGAWKLLINEDLGRTELYNIEEDWAEKTNLVAEHPEIVEQLTRQLHEWQKTLPKNPPASCMSRARSEQ